MLINQLTGHTIAPFQALSRELDRMFDGFLDGPTRRQSSPAICAWETAEAFEIEAQVPGLRAEDLEVSVHGNRVTMRGEHKETKREGATSLRREWTAYQFERSFDLPVDVDDKKVVAELRDGVLHLTLPKAAGHLPQKIKVLAAK